ncbi:MAG: sigma 54-interacting transcriptional regulator, partial [candidate division Zixibacteria bacterium]|nr:sigma 54-interacting transcriptional regulator [candidate division Zixibacteria bacterium]
MTKETSVGIEARDTVTYYIASLVRKRDYAGAVRYYENNRDTVEAAGAACAGLTLHHVARAYASLADYRTALRIARIAQNRLSEEGNSLLLAENFVTLGSILNSLGELKEAEKACRDAESIFRREDCLEGRSRALNLLAGLFYRQNDYSHSLSILMDAISIVRRLGDKKKLAYMMGNIGRIHTFIGELDEAKKYLLLGTELSTELDDWHEVMRSKIALGYVYLREGNYTYAEGILEDVYPDTVTLGSRREEIICLTYLGELRYCLNRLDESRKTLEKALKLSRKIGRDMSLAGCAMRHLAEVLVRQRNFRKARQFVSKAMIIMEKVNDKIEIAALYRINAIIAEDAGRNDEARDQYSEAIELLEETRLRSEMAEVLTAAGNSTLFEPRKRLTFLFRAEAFYSRYRLTLKLQKVDRIISNIECQTATAIGSRSHTSESCTEDVDFLTNCQDIQKFKSQMAAIGKSDLTVLLTGETGVGKDHLAHYYHHVVRPGTPYVAVNCASLPETLLESELFGYQRGAFTGAESDKKGLFAAANGGVLLLDEIGDMPLTLQTKLLGVLENKKITPLGST